MNKIIGKDIDLQFRKNVESLQENISDMGGALVGSESEVTCPVKHSFGEGCYIREIFMPAGTFIISKLHKITHPYFILKGKVSVVTEDGTVILEGPYQGMTKAGTKRALYIHEDTVWITVHVTDKTDLAEIEKEVIAKNYEEYDKFISIKENRKIIALGCIPIESLLMEAS